MPEEQKGKKRKAGERISYIPCKKCHTVTYELQTEATVSGGQNSNWSRSVSEMVASDSYRNLVNKVMQEMLKWVNQVKCEEPCVPVFKFIDIDKSPKVKADYVAPIDHNHSGTWHATAAGEIGVKVCCRPR